MPVELALGGARGGATLIDDDVAVWASRYRWHQHSIVLDPFGGAGTVGLVADSLGRDAILIELNADYCAMAERRLKAGLVTVEGGGAQEDDHGPLFANGHQDASQPQETPSFCRSSK